MNAHDKKLFPKSTETDIKTGLKSKYRAQICERLSSVLTQTYKLTIKSHVFHWNVVGPLFKPIHELTELHYNDLFAATDVIAERIRALGHLAPASFSDLDDIAPKASKAGKLVASEMITELVNDHESLVREMREIAGEAGDAGDVVTEDMLTARMTFHEQAVWMLRAGIAE